MRWILLLFVAVACGTTDPPVDGGKDASMNDGTIDCSRIGCAMPPPCGQKCTAVCGCCGCPTGAICSVCDGGSG